MAGHGAAFRQAGGGEHLYAVADGADVFILLRELAHEDSRLGSFRRYSGARPKNYDGGEVAGGHGSDGDIGFNTVAGTLDVSLPARFGVVDHHVQAAARGRGDDGLPVGFEKPR